MTRVISSLLSTILLAVSAVTGADCQPILLKPGASIVAPNTAVSVQLVRQGENRLLNLAFRKGLSAEGTTKVWKVSEGDIKAIQAAIEADHAVARSMFEVLWVQEDGKPADSASFAIGSERAVDVCFAGQTAVVAAPVVIPPGGKPPTGNPPENNPPAGNPPQGNPPGNNLPAANPPGANPVPNNAQKVASVSLEVCTEASKKWINEELKKQKGNGGFSAVVFDPLGNLCYWYPPRGGTEGDPIFVGVVAQKDWILDLSAPSFSPCALEPEEFAIKVGDTSVFNNPAFQAQGASKDQQYQVRSFPAQICFSPVVQVEIASRVLNPPDPLKTYKGTYTVNQAKRYRGGLQLGVLFTDLHDNGFEVRQVGGQSVAFDTGPVDNGPEWVASLVVYGLPHYLTALGTKTPYAGRDILHDQSLADRLGLLISVGIEHPGDRFGAGLSFELVAGLNVAGVYEWAKVDRLVGLSDQDPFSGTTADLPVRETWESGFTWALSLDLRYVTALFQHK